MTTTFASLADLEAHVGKPLGASEWRVLPFAQILAFAEATGDRQWIHTDEARAAAGPFGAPIAHGYLTLSLVAGHFFEVLRLENFPMILNYGCNKVRFPAPLKAGARYRLALTLQSARPIDGGAEVVFAAAIEIEGSPKPAVAAEVVYRVQV